MTFQDQNDKKLLSYMGQINKAQNAILEIANLTLCLFYAKTF